MMTTADIHTGAVKSMSRNHHPYENMKTGPDTPHMMYANTVLSISLHSTAEGQNQ